MHQIAEKAEYAVGTLYNFFKNKEDLYKAILMETADMHFAVMSEILTREDNVVDILNEFLNAQASMVAKNSAVVRLYVAETSRVGFSLKAGLTKELRRKQGAVSELMVAVMARGVREKVLRDFDPQDIALTLEGMVSAFLFHSVEGPDKDEFEKKLPIIRDIFFRGVLAS